MLLVIQCSPLTAGFLFCFVLFFTLQLTAMTGCLNLLFKENIHSIEATLLQKGRLFLVQIIFPCEYISSLSVLGSSCTFAGFSHRRGLKRRFGVLTAGKSEDFS